MGLRALVLEDDAAHGRLLGLQLAEIGVETHLVEEGRWFLEFLGRESFDFAVVDLKLPDMDGRECIRAVRRDLGLKIAHSDDADQSFQSHADQIGA